MDEMNPTTPDLAPNESNHPVLQALHSRIQELEAKVAKGLELDAERIQTINRIRNEKWQYEENAKNVLVAAVEDFDIDTIKHIAEQLGIILTQTKQFEVNVTFTVDIEVELGDEIDPDWDIEFTASHSDLVDYTSDVIYSKEI
jgi:hypothetical protein